ncbi:hypothetical protein VTK73DRAFT_3527 [Phialemonium thermophilum]|uniref:Flavin reductase like domain-containing protein n=1 Tax=Phialemonium thermophilum TaxID=223376 RepID=A0ABR3Y0L3_9PEZI
MPRKRKHQEKEAGEDASSPTPSESHHQSDIPSSDSGSSGSKKRAKEPDLAANKSLHHGFDHYPPTKVYRLIEPGPVVMVTTGSLAEGTHNVMTMGFHMMIQHESPPLIGICLGPWDASFAALKKRRECVLVVPSVEMAEVVVDVGNCSADDDDEEGRGDGKVNKWKRFGLEAVPARRVKAPLVAGPHIIANIECVVEDTKMVSKYSMWVLRAVKAWINPGKRPGEAGGGKMFHHRGDGTFVIDGEILDLKKRMVKWQEFQD